MDILTTFRVNPGLLVLTVLVAGGAAVFGLVALMMSSSGASLRPVIFVAVFFGLVAIPQWIGQLALARAPVANAATKRLQVVDDRFTDRLALFGPEVDPAAIQDARPVFLEFLSAADHAELAIRPDGETVVAATFLTVAAAKDAAARYTKLFAVGGTGGSEEEGWTGKRGLTGDRVVIRVAGPHLFVWTGASADAIAARYQAVRPLIDRLGVEAGPPLWSGGQVLVSLFRPVGMKVAGLLVLLALVVGWFFKGAMWAAERPSPVAESISMSELRERLLSMNRPPMLVSSPSPTTVVATWSQDPGTLSLGQSNNLRRTFRLELRLDESARKVHVLEQRAGFDWRAAVDQGSLQWHTVRSITMFEGRTQFGNAEQLNRMGLRQPIIEIVSAAGWTWRPVFY